MPARKKPKYSTTVEHVEVLVPKGELLTLEDDSPILITVLGAALSGPDMLYQYVRIRESTPDA